MAPSHGRGTTARVNPHLRPLAGGGPAAGWRPPSRRAFGRDQAAALACATVVALAAHAWMLGLWATPAWSRKTLPLTERPARATAATFEVRRVLVALAPAALATPAAPAALEAPAAPEAPEAPARAQPLPASAAPTPPPSTALRLGTASPLVAATPTQALSMSRAGTPAEEPASAAIGEPASAAGGDPASAPSLPPSSPAPPTYRTAPPPSVDLDYEVQRGGATGAARIAWRLGADGHYALEMTGVGPAAAAGALTPHWKSQGSLDADGVAPERFAVSRRGRERHAANFRRDVGIVSFAGPSRTWPLAAGAQDRLSWMVQLAAVLRANPELAAQGAQISMMVAGAHGDAGVWTFIVAGPLQAVAGPGGEPVPAWPLTRESGHAHDPQVQVWLAPSLHHLPVRLKLTLPRSGESTEMQLRALQAP